MTNWTTIKDLLAGIPHRDLHKLGKLVRKEKHTRWLEDMADTEWRREGFGGLANFMAGVTWALACRAALRASKGHKGFGKRPAAGNMWTPRELLSCVRHQVKELGWHPITSESAAVVMQNLEGQEAAARAPKHIDDGPFQAVQFGVRMASGGVVRRVADRFDYGGEA